MERVGAVQFNNRLAWCGVNDSERKVFFSIWADNACTHGGEKGYIIQGPDWGINEITGNKEAPRSDQDAKLALVFDQGYEPFGYFIVAKDPTAHPREIEETRTSFVVRLSIKKLPDGSIFGVQRERIEVR
jgi:hypothetical protein